MDRQELLKLREGIRRKYLADIAAIDRVLSLMPGTEEPAPTEPTELPMGDSDDGPKRPTKVIRSIIQSKTTTFSMRDLLAEYEDVKPKGMGPVSKRYLSLLLRRMENKGELERVQTGSGKTPTVYRRKN